MWCLIQRCGLSRQGQMHRRRHSDYSLLHPQILHLMQSNLSWHTSLILAHESQQGAVDLRLKRLLLS